MHNNRTGSLSLPLRRGSVCVVEGYGVSVHIKRGHLVVEDGFGREHRRRVFSRATHDFSRVVVLGHEGFVTFEAIRWLADLGIAYLHVDRDGRVLATSASTSGDARLRRQQALAPSSGVGLELARTILGAKLDGQREILAQLTDSTEALEALDGWRFRLADGHGLEELLEAEREAALLYWFHWRDVQCRFVTRDATVVPEHWGRFGRRHSPFTNSSRLALNPLNALLNYLYAILEAETRLTCLITGLDPGLGIVHVDYRNRDSFVLDLMEVGRPAVDAYVLELARTRTFRAQDFGETRRGVCRVLAPLAHELASTAPLWRESVGAFAEAVAGMLADAPDSRIDALPTPLTRANRVGAGRRGGTVRVPSHRAESAQTARPFPRCKRCGEPVPRRERVYCDTCLPHYQREQYAEAFNGAGLEMIARRKKEGVDPTHGGIAASRRAQANVERKRELREWDQRYGKLTDLSRFAQQILPQIRGIPLSQLVRATGLSLRYCSQIRRGERVPHPKHWPAFEQAARARER